MSQSVLRPAALAAEPARFLSFAYLLLAVLGPLGAHQLYLGRLTNGALLALATLWAVSHLADPAPIGRLILAGVVVALALDATRLPSLLRDAAADAARNARRG